MRRAGPSRQTGRHAFEYASALGCAVSLILVGCASPSAPSPRAAPEEPPVQQRDGCADDIVAAEPAGRVARLERELTRLRDDLRDAESTMARIESGESSRDADVVSALAESRIALERAAGLAPWRKREIEALQRKLDVAERERRADHRATAIFLASRARRDAIALIEEGQHVASARNARFIRGSRVRLRAGPSTDHAILDVLEREAPVFAERPQGDWVLVSTVGGQRGWVYGPLLR